ncbi:MAG: hypothetical protein R3C56_09830 [Pirellulaceae bacterium]
MSWGETLLRLIAFLVSLAALYLLCGLYIYFQYDRRLLTDPTQLIRLLGLVVVACALSLRVARSHACRSRAAGAVRLDHDHHLWSTGRVARLDLCRLMHHLGPRAGHPLSS